MKDTFNKIPKTYLIFMGAVVVTAVVCCSFLYYKGNLSSKIVTKESVTPPPAPAEEKVEQKFVDYSQFGVVFIEVDSPSYAQSNFDVNPNTPITVYLNREVDPQEVADKFSLINKNTGEAINTQVTSQTRAPEDKQDSYTWKWQEVWQQKLIFTPNLELAPITRYSAEIQAGYPDLAGQDIAKDSFQFEFMTADIPGILSTNLDNDGGILRSNDPIKIFFRSPMDTMDLEKSMTVTPLPGNLLLSNNDKVLVIENTFEVGGTYTLSIPYDTKDIYGRNLGENVEYVFTVQ